MLAKTGPGQKSILAQARRPILLDHFRARDVGRHQVGRELDAIELQRQGAGQRADHQRLGQPGHAHQQTMAPGKDGDQQLLDDLLLPHDDLAQFVRNLMVGNGKCLHRLAIF